MGASAASRARLHTTSIPVVIETFTFLDRNAIHDVARWRGRKPLRARLGKNPAVRACDLEQSWEYFRRAGLHQLSTADATSFVIMKRARIHRAYSFDHHFALASFRLCHSLNENGAPAADEDGTYWFAVVPLSYSAISALGPSCSGASIAQVISSTLAGARSRVRPIFAVSKSADDSRWLD
jgi:predicted nucleic acid-binding protein